MPRRARELTVSHQPGALLAVGNTSTIHAWGHGRVAKVLLPATPPGWADLEAEMTARVRATGLPVPDVIDVIDVDGRRAIISERIEGPTMLSQVVAQPSSIDDHARTLAELQAWFHTVPAPLGLPSLRTRLTAKIHDAHLAKIDRDGVLTRLAELPDGEQVCHGDLHPGNVIFADGERPVVVDWFDVTAGSPLADVARTSLLIRPRHRTGPPTYLGGVANGLLAAFHDAYLGAYADITERQLDAVTDWELPVAAARLSESVEHDDLIDIVRHARHSDRGTGDDVIRV